MPTLASLIELNDSLSIPFLHFNNRLCVSSRNRHSSCRKCVNRCPVSALHFAGSSVYIDDEKCVNCGACTTACPVQALTSQNPSDIDLAVAASSAVKAMQGDAYLCCDRVRNKHDLDDEKVLSVACLARIDEALLLGLAAHGVRKITLIDGDCKSCKYHDCGEYAQRTFRGVKEMLDAFDHAASLETTTQVPSVLLARQDAESIGEMRRALFFHTKSFATDAAKRLAYTQVKESTGIDLEAKQKNAKQPVTQRHEHILEALDALGTPQSTELSTLRFGSIDIIEAACESCSKCVLACPQKALTKSLVPREDKGIYYEFDASKCNRCGICVDVCHKHCLHMRPTTNIAEIFDFEPRLIPVPASPWPSVPTGAEKINYIKSFL